jgi:MFS family permease
MTRVTGAARQTFRSLRSHNYRLYFFGQIISVSGTWMQSVALGWLVLKLTDSGAWLGLVIAAQFLPMLLLGPFGGVIADRVDKRRFLFVTQSLSGVLAIVLVVLVVTGSVELWMVFALAVAVGTVNAFDMPTRQTFVYEMVGPDLLSNAVTLNSVVMNGARIVGPAVAGVLIATVGLAPCFFVNGVSYAACIGALAMMHPADLIAGEPRGRQKGQLREGFHYVWSNRALRTPLLLMAAIGTLTYEFQISLPLVARYTFGAGADGYGGMTSAMGLGAVVGGLVAANRARPTRRKMGQAGIVFGILVLVASGMPSFAATVVVLPLVGAASITFISLANTNLQLIAAPEMRGRVMALYSVAFMGSTPIGGPMIGWVGQAFGPRSALVLGGVTAVVASVAAWRSLNRSAPLTLTAGQVAEAARVGAAEAEWLESGQLLDELAGEPLVELVDEPDERLAEPALARAG